MEELEDKLYKLQLRFDLGKIDEDVFLRKEKTLLDAITILKEVEDEEFKVFLLIKEKKEELEKLKKMHESMWKTYGSELSAGGMSADEEKLENEIKELEEKLYGDNSDDN